MKSNEPRTGEVHVYGGFYRVIPTQDAMKALRKLDSDGEPLFWQVAIFSNREQLWMNNCDGEIIILTDGEESYYRMF